jgi:tetratricopeptide (TPR) repeat protein
MPEKTMQEIPANVRGLYAKGKEAADRNNLDYALTIFLQVLTQEPGFYDCREAIRSAQIRKTGEGGGFFKKIVSSANPLLAKGQLALRKNPLDAIVIAEQMLNGDANNWSAHKLLAEAALAADLPRTAVLSLELVFKNNSKDRDAAINLARAYAANRQASKAMAIYEDLMRANPNDVEIVTASKQLAAQRTLDEQGYSKLEGGQGSYRDVLKDKTEAVRLEQQSRLHKDEDTLQSILDRKVDELAADPSNLQLAREVADLYAQGKNYDKALKYYKMLAEIPGQADPTLDRAISTITLKALEQRLEQLDKTAPDHEEQAVAIQAEIDAYQFEDCKRRADKYPNDLGLKFELGTFYFKAGQVTEAIQEFQKAQRDPHRRVQAIFYLGRCFAERGMHEMAVRQLNAAIAERTGMDDEKKDMIYTLACVLEKMGKADEAIKQFEKIYEVDIGYRDIAAKVDAFYSGGGAKAGA